MKITMYELLGLVKDGKAPKKIKYENREYYLYDNKSYLTTDKTRFFYRIYFSDLNIKVEILKEEKKIPEKLKIEQDGHTYNNFYIVNQNGTKCYLTKHSKMIAETLNQVIDYLNRKGDK